MRIFYTKKFEREYKKVSRELKLKAETREIIFKKNPHNKVLKTHKLSGELNNLWSFSVDYKNRIIFEFVDNDTVFFHSIGDHDIYN